MFDQKINKDELIITFSRSSGPGGQNVNKVNTKAELRWAFLESSSLTEREKEIIKNHSLLRQYLTNQDEIVLSEQSTRSQVQNKELVIKKLIEIIEKALKPIKKRKKTKVPKGAKEKRLKEKKHRSEVKKNRKPTF